MTEPRQHHLVPESFLRRFADERGQVRAVGREDRGRTFCPSIKSFPTERDFYSVETAEGRCQRIESEFLSYIETHAPPAIDALLKSRLPLGEEQRAAISLFVTCQWLRDRNRREAIRTIIEHADKQRIMNTTRDSLRRFFRECMDREGTEEEIDECIEFVSDPDRYRTVAHQNELVRAQFEKLVPLTEITRRRAWCLFTWDSPCLVSSDSPVSTWSPPEVAHLAGGLVTTVEVGIALDRRHFLLMVVRDCVDDHRRIGDGDRALRGTPEQARCFNDRTAAAATQWIIHHPDDTPPLAPELPPVAKMRITPPPMRIVPDGH